MNNDKKFNGILINIFRQICTFRWKPSWDLLVVGISWLLVVGALYVATFIVSSTAGGGMPYFALYGIVMAGLFGIGIPLFWMVIIRKRPLSDLGITFKRWRISILIQMVLAVLLYFIGPKFHINSFTEFIPLVALDLAIGFFEAVFWRGWVVSRLEESFGMIPAILLGSGLYALYHLGYGMSWNDMLFLFFIGIMFAVVFKLTGSVLILWPIFQPMGQLITLTEDGLVLPLIAVLGFVDAMALMFTLIWLTAKYYKKYKKNDNAKSQINTQLNILKRLTETGIENDNVQGGK
jgi:uncharacterized protein